jgi:hypothetical protein
MTDKRTVQRVDCFSKCLLLHKNSQYPGVLENISVDGALVTMTNSLPNVIQLGDTCGLLFCSDQEFSPNEYNSKVVRISSPYVGLQFIK